MSQAPHKAPPPPQPTPDNPYELQPVQPPAQERDLTAEILTISVIAACFVLLGVGAMLWVRDNRPAARPPTPTSTQIAQLVPPPINSPVPVTSLTPNASAPTPTPNTALALPLVTGNSGTPDAVTSPSAVHLPAISSDDRASATPTATSPATPSPAPTPASTMVAQALRFLALPYISVQVPPTPTPAPPTATPVPTETSAPGVPATATSTVAGTPIGTPLTTPTTAPTGVPLIIDNMQAFLRQPAEFFVGPSSIYTVTDSLASNVELTLRGRDATGEWVYACCVDEDDDGEDDDNAWVRQAFVTIEGNELDGPDDDEDDIDRNDVRWLRVVPTRPDLRPLPTVTPPPEGDFPLFRYTPDNRAYLPNLPNLATAVRPWTTEPQAGGALQAPLIVADSLVYGASADNHIYSWDRSNGSQRARRFLDAQTTFAPAADNGLAYFVDQTGLLHALQDPIDQEPIWRTDLAALPIEPLTGINVYSHTLFINMNGLIFVVDGEEGTIRHELSLPANPLYPAIGGQLVYVVADATVGAYDALMMIENDSTDLIWEAGNLSSSTVPPVYTSIGVESLAELYIAGSNNRIYSLDANTGIENWNDDNEEPITGLAVSNDRLYISGENYVKARTRNAPEENLDPVLWRTPVAGPILAGPIVGPQYVIVFLQNGNILFFDAATGEPSGNFPTYPAQGSSAGAVSFPYVFAPGQDGKLYGYRQSP